MKKSIVVILFFFINFISYSQISFMKFYGRVYEMETFSGSSVEQTADGGYIAIGNYYNSWGADDVFLIRTNAYGDTLWTRIINNSTNEGGYDIHQTPDGGFVYNGYILQTGFGLQACLVKVDANGYQQWIKEYGKSRDETSYSFERTFENGYILAGYSKNTASGDSHMYLIRTDDNGDTLWTKVYESADPSYGYCVRQTIDSGFVVAGKYYLGNISSKYEPALLRTDKLGNLMFYKEMPIAGMGTINSLCQLPDSGFALAGRIIDTVNNTYLPLLIRTDKNGDTLWTKKYGVNQGVFLSIEKTRDSCLVMAGQSNDLSVLSNLYLVKTNLNGDTMWTRSFYIDDWAPANHIQQTSDNGYIIVGSVGFMMGGGEVVLLKLDGNGILQVEPHVSIEKVPAIFPNPASEYLVVNLGNNIVDEPVQVFSIAGELLLSKTVSGGSCLFDVSVLPAGVYIIKAGFVTGKFVKE
ncbi:MAG: T9SS type A sorting domain-containing protein [Bacteroidota bacterium]